MYINFINKKEFRKLIKWKRKGNFKLGQKPKTYSVSKLNNVKTKDLQCIKVKQRPNPKTYSVSRLNNVKTQRLTVYQSKTMSKPKTYSVSRLNNVKTKDLQCIKVKQHQNQRLTEYQS